MGVQIHRDCSYIIQKRRTYVGFCSSRYLFQMLTMFFSFYSLPRAAGVLLLGTVGEIGKNSLESMETACKIMEDKQIHPFAFRVHTHELGTFLSSSFAMHISNTVKFRTSKHSSYVLGTVSNSNFLHSRQIGELLCGVRRYCNL